jgi:hypothetical protein
MSRQSKEAVTMSRDSGNRRGRRLFLVALLMLLIPTTSQPRASSACEGRDSVIDQVFCTPIELVRIFGPLARYLMLSA